MKKDQSEKLQLNKVAKLVFKEDNGDIYLGGEKIKPELRALLKEQARYISTSQFFEILDATITNESFEIAVGQSKNWEHVISAKMLYHWNHVFKKMISALIK